MNCYDHLINTFGLFNLPMITHELQVSLKPSIAPILTAFFLLYLSALSLPSPGPLPVLFRISLLPFLGTLAYDILLNRNYSFGSPLRDTAFPSLAFIILFRALDFSLVTLWDPERAFHWIVPDESSDQSEQAKSTSEPLQTEPYASEEFEVSKPNQVCASTQKKLDGVLSANGVCRRWRKVPHPPIWSIDRWIWALDNLLLMRPGTALVRPWRLRALSWSQRALESPHTAWGVAEWPLIPAVIQQAAHALCHAYIRHLNLDGSKPLWEEPLYVQCALTFALGGIVTFGNALEEAIVYPLIARFKLLPPTALVPNSRRAILSSGLVDLWGKRWHHVWRRSFVRLARLLPGASHPLVHAFATFYISATMHCILLARLYPIPTLKKPTSFIPLIFEPGVMIFFLCQGAGTVVERVWFPVRPTDGPVRKLIRWIWLYFVLIGSGRWVTNSLVVKGLMAKKEWDMLNWTVVIRMLIGLVWPTGAVGGA